MSSIDPDGNRKNGSLSSPPHPTKAGKTICLTPSFRRRRLTARVDGQVEDVERAQLLDFLDRQDLLLDVSTARKLWRGLIAASGELREGRPTSHFPHFVAFRRLQGQPGGVLSFGALHHEVAAAGSPSIDVRIDHLRLIRAASMGRDGT